MRIRNDGLLEWRRYSLTRLVCLENTSVNTFCGTFFRYFKYFLALDEVVEFGFTCLALFLILFYFKRNNFHTSEHSMK